MSIDASTGPPLLREGRRACRVDERVEVGLLRRRHTLRLGVLDGRRGLGAAAAAPLGGALAGGRDLHALEPFVEEELVARGGNNADVDASTPMPITRLLSSRSLCTRGVKSLSPVPSTKVVM